MRILITMHHPEEGPGTLGDFLAARGADLVYARLFAGESIPQGEFDAVVSMGGPMNVYEELMHPWLAEETAYLAGAAQKGVPLLGICLGAQLIAKALGAKVVKSPVEEIGWRKLELTGAGLADPLFKGLPRELTVFQWHGDMFEIPAGAELLAGGAACPHQAFGLGKACGLQFHVEVTRPIVRAWCENESQKKLVETGWEENGPEMARQAGIIFENFWELITS